jgi:polyisoprenyl-teichoic acid--peptidoglycan teichoic acid transferase
LKKLLKTGFIVLNTTLIFFLLIQNMTMNKKMDRLQTNLAGGLEESRNVLDRTVENMNLFAGGTNQLLFMNGMSPLALDYGEEELSDSEPVDPELAKEKQKEVFFEALDYLIEVNHEYDGREAFEKLILTDSFKRWIRTEKLNIEFSSTLSGSLIGNGKALMDFKVDTEGFAHVSDVEGREAYVKDEGELIAFVKEFEQIQKEREDNYSQWSTSLGQFPYRKDLSATINEKQIKLKSVSSEDRFELLIRMSDYIVKERAGVLKATGELYLGDTVYIDWDSFESDLLAYINGLDGRTDREVRDDEVKEFLISLLQEQNLLDYMDQQGLVLSKEIRQSEDTDYLNWDFYNTEGERIGSFAVLEGFGEIYLLDGDDVVLRSLRKMNQNDAVIDLDGSWQGEKVGPIGTIVSSDDTENYLVVGSHERNADTMILVHVNSKTGNIKMISIPRDLWYKNRKLNSVYRYYGIDALASDVSELTGLKIDKYMAIDMYAFIDVINILDGIDIELEEPLNDPTYHIKENGVWTTLNYPAGPIHLDGLGALRVARSRHSTNDYSRSRRQQLIIGAIFHKLSRMGLSDADKLTDFIKAAVKYTETNISPGTLVMDVMKYRKSELSTRNVIDETNIVYGSFSNIYKLSKEEQEAAMADDNFYRGAWISLPRDNNYNLIKWYIQEILNG